MAGCSLFFGLQLQKCSSAKQTVKNCEYSEVPWQFCVCYRSLPHKRSQYTAQSVKTSGRCSKTSAGFVIQNEKANLFFEHFQRQHCVKAASIVIQINSRFFPYSIQAICQSTAMNIQVVRGLLQMYSIFKIHFQRSAIFGIVLPVHILQHFDSFHAQDPCRLRGGALIQNILQRIFREEQ